MVNHSLVVGGPWSCWFDWQESCKLPPWMGLFYQIRGIPGRRNPSSAGRRCCPLPLGDLALPANLSTFSTPADPLASDERSVVYPEMELEPPDDFKCPISLEVMSDPVILSSGHTFDRSSIQRWLDSGNHTCPVTQLPLPPHPRLIPNHALRSLISNFAPHAFSPSYPSHTHSLQTLLSSVAYPSDLQTITQIHQASKKDAAFRSYLANSGTVPVLLRHVESKACAKIRELALRVLLDVSLDGDDVKVGLVADGAVDCVSTVLFDQDDVGYCRALAATILTSLAIADVNKCTIGANSSAMAGLAMVLKEGKGRERREATTALYVLCSFPENRRRTVQLGAVPVLVELADSGVERAVEVLGLLGKCREGREETRRVTGFVSVLAGVLRKGKSRGVEHALVVLKHVCSDSEETSREVWREGVLDMALSLAGEGKGKIGENAARLVDTLRSRGFWSSA